MKTLTAVLAGMAGALVSLALVGAGGTTGKTSQTIRAERFEVVDATGKVSAVLGMRTDGTPGLWLFDKAGTERVGLVVDKDGTPGQRWGRILNT